MIFQQETKHNKHKKSFVKLQMCKAINLTKWTTYKQFSMIMNLGLDLISLLTLSSSKSWLRETHETPNEVQRNHSDSELSILSETEKLET